MKLNKVLFGLGLVVSASSVLAAQPAPVIDVSSPPPATVNNNTSTVTTTTSPLPSPTTYSAPKGSVAEQLVSLERKLDARNRAQVNVQRQLDELQNEVNELRGVTELHTHQLSQVLDRQRELYQELDRRVSQALKPTNQVPAAIGATNTPASNSSSVNYSSDLTENEAYDRAVNLVLKEKKYEQAIPEFRAFNQKYPQSSYAANAHYWLGQLLFNKGELAEAKQEFEVVVNQFTDSSKRGDALLKLAMVEQKQDNRTKAISLYRKLIAEYPSSSAAQLAKPRLDSLTQ
ncbi:tol-pal system protein YbgF [Thalassotalea sp. PLHSN55]|uniref:tol-pal system protein YbgF n=1 Tax=Thalassotalea sp. PLHSN55 TaxID=3435888 RepID=UPI003F82A636